MRHLGHVEADPDRHDNGLGNQERGSPKEAGECLGFDAEPVTPEDRGQMDVEGMEAERVVRPLRGDDGLGRWHSVPGSFSGEYVRRALLHHSGTSAGRQASPDLTAPPAYTAVRETHTGTVTRQGLAYPHGVRPQDPCS